MTSNERPSMPRLVVVALLIPLNDSSALKAVPNNQVQRAMNCPSDLKLATDQPESRPVVTAHRPGRIGNDLAFPFRRAEQSDGIQQAEIYCSELTPPTLKHGATGRGLPPIQYRRSRKSMASDPTAMFQNRESVPDPFVFQAFIKSST